MTRMVDCLVNYFSQEADEEGMPRRYFSYHVVGSPGPTDDSGVASITTLALYDENQRCSACQRFFATKTGGPAQALANALHYLDIYHEGERLVKVQTAVRGLPADLPRLESVRAG